MPIQSVESKPMFDHRGSFIGEHVATRSYSNCSIIVKLGIYLLAWTVNEPDENIRPIFWGNCFQLGLLVGIKNCTDIDKLTRLIFLRIFFFF